MPKSEMQKSEMPKSEMHKKQVNAARQRRHRERKAKSDKVQLRIWVPSGRADEIRAIVDAALASDGPETPTEAQRGPETPTEAPAPRASLFKRHRG